MDLDTWALCYNVSFVGCLAGVERQRGQHLARPSQRVCGHGVYTHGAQVEETSHAPLGAGGGHSTHPQAL